MNEKTDQWESYTDKAGRQHWRLARGERASRRTPCR